MNDCTFKMLDYTILNVRLLKTFNLRLYTIKFDTVQLQMYDYTPLNVRQYNFKQESKKLKM